ncbi:MAG: GxxExxY protein [Thiomargarita sp.]|nr:GxxExxY protein [Thiomargarita sp.]
MYNDLTFQINHCLFTVFNKLKNLWNENVYEEALQLELAAQDLKAECQKKFEVFYIDKRVGLYAIDILVEELVILELKAVPQVLPIHQAQLISYLKGYSKPIGILANFGEKSLYHQTIPNKLAQKTPLRDAFDFSKVQLKSKEEIKDLLLMANKILVTLGVGYFHQIYRRAFYYELKMAKIDFEVIKKMTAVYDNHILDTKEVILFILGDLLLSVLAVKTLDEIILSRFANQIKYFDCKRGLIFNFNRIHLDYRYLENL